MERMDREIIANVKQHLKKIGEIKNWAPIPHPRSHHTESIPRKKDHHYDSAFWRNWRNQCPYAQNLSMSYRFSGIPRPKNRMKSLLQRKSPYRQHLCTRNQNHCNTPSSGNLKKSMKLLQNMNLQLKSSLHWKWNWSSRVKSWHLRFLMSLRYTPLLWITSSNVESLRLSLKKSLHGIPSQLSWSSKLQSLQLCRLESSTSASPQKTLSNHRTLCHRILILN